MQAPVIIRMFTEAMIFEFVFICTVVLLPECNSTHVPIGLVLEPHSRIETAAVTYAVEYANANILKHGNLVLNIYKLADSDQIRSSIQQACHVVADGNVLQIGPAGSENVHAAASVLEAFNIPLISPIANNPLITENANAIYMVPSGRLLGKALGSVIEKLAWKRITLLCSDDSRGLSSLRSLVEVASSKGWGIGSMQTFPSDHVAPNVTTQLNVLRHTGVRVVVLSCAFEHALHVLKEAERKFMTGPGWNWVVAGITDIEQLFPEHAPDYMNGIIALGFPVPSGQLAMEFHELWRVLNPNEYWGTRPKTIPISVARWIDAILAVAHAIEDNGGLKHLPGGLSCIEKGNWSHGREILRAIKNVKKPGVAQDISFSSAGCTIASSYVIYNFRPGGWVKVATWNPGVGYEAFSSEKIILPGGAFGSPDSVSSINGKHLRIVTIQREPFSFPSAETELPNSLDLNTGVEMIGYCVDMLSDIARILNFTFTLYLVADDKFGGKNITSGSWNGLNCDLAIAPLTISRVRERAIDFSHPYIDTGLGVALPKEEVVVRNSTFMLPYQMKFWLVFVTSIILMGLAINMLEKTSPFGYHGEFVQTPHDMARMNRNQRYRRQYLDATNVMRVDNAIWFTIAATFQQGYDRYPRSVSSRFICLVWFLSVLAVVSYYTAELGSGLIVSRLQASVNTVLELYSQDRIRYGTLKDSATEEYLCQSEVPLYKNMCLQMKKWDSWVYKQEQLLQWLSNPNYAYAFMGDTTVIEALTQRKPCNVRQLAEAFNPNGFGIGMQKGSPYLEIISQTVLQLREQRVMDDLYTKWFTMRSECAVDDGSSSDEENVVKFSDLRGVFYVIMVAIGMSHILLIVELTYACIMTRQKRGMATVFCRILQVMNVYLIPMLQKVFLGFSEFELPRQRDLWNAQEDHHRIEH